MRTGPVLAEFVSGNAIGIVEAPADGQGDLMVKIGVLDQAEPCSQDSFQTVIEKLLDHLRKESPTESAGATRYLSKRLAALHKAQKKP